LRMFPTVESFNDFRIEKKDGARSTFRKLADIGYVNKHINEKIFSTKLPAHSRRAKSMLANGLEKRKPL